MDTNDEIVDSLVERGFIQSERVEKAFRSVDRKNFVPEEQEGKAYVDTPLPIAGGSVTSAPHMIAENTELLDPDRDSRVIEIGSGSGYQVAILAELVEEGEVLGVDVIEELVEKSRDRLDYSNVEVFHGNGFNPVEGKFDRILYSCAIETFDEAREHLKENGIAVAPMYADHAQVLRKLENGKVTDHGFVRFMPLVEEGEEVEIPQKIYSE
ncbi:MAG: protein-L-isoaspartate O-methyltransferase [Candidatus Nanohalobium sp.]